MVFCLVLFALCGVIAFFHYVQGFFSAAISAILAVIAAMVAMGWFETAAPLLFNAGMRDQAASISLVLIFALCYGIPRILMDSLVQGNVRTNFIVDKVGAAVMGLIAGLIGSGIVALAADALPFGPTVGMYSRFTTGDVENLIYTGSNGISQDSKANDVVQADKIDPDDPNISHVWFRQDDLVVGLIKAVSADTGSLSNGRPFGDVHPDLIDELYGQRIGIQTGAKHTAFSTDQTPTVAVKGLYTPPRPIPQVDGEQSSMRKPDYQAPPSVMTPDADQIALVVRMQFSGRDMADDADNLLRYSAGALHLVAGRPDSGIPFKDYYPVATLDNKGIAVANRPDDFLLSDMGSTRTVDFVFLVDQDHVMGGDETKPPFHLPAGTFVEFKRYAAVDLSGQEVDFGPPPNADKTPVIRRPQIAKVLANMDGLWTGSAALSENPSAGNGGSTGGGSSGGGSESGGGSGGTPEVGPAPGATGNALGDSGLSFEDIAASNKLSVPVNCGTGDDSGTVQLPNGVGGQVTHRQWSQLTVTADTTIEQLGTPASDNIQALAVDPNTVLVQVHCAPPASGSSSRIWGWAKGLADFNLLDATGSTYPCVGAWASVQRGTDRFVAVNYKNIDDQGRLQPLATPSKGRPVDVWLAFQVPSGTPIAGIRYSGSTVMDGLNFKAP